MKANHPDADIVIVNLGTGQPYAEAPPVDVPSNVTLLRQFLEGCADTLQTARELERFDGRPK